jgi:hypothetical protein
MTSDEVERTYYPEISLENKMKKTKSLIIARASAGAPIKLLPKICKESYM